MNKKQLTNKGLEQMLAPIYKMVEDSEHLSKDAFTHSLGKIKVFLSNFKHFSQVFEDKDFTKLSNDIDFLKKELVFWEKTDDRTSRLLIKGRLTLLQNYIWNLSRLAISR